MDEKLAEMTCSRPTGDDAPLTGQELETYLARVPVWELVEEDGVNKLTREFEFRNFAEALDFANVLGQVAEEQGHHPIISLTWGWACVTWFTHRIGGLHENDFIMAAKTDEIYAKR